MIREVKAELKLVIPGNHDLLLDQDFWLRRIGWEAEGTEKEVRKHYPALAWDMVRELRRAGVQFLSEGTYDYVLQNGARLRVYASPQTPAFGGWPFQYSRGKHAFDIPADVDVAMTHGPPLNILDETNSLKNSGCEMLFQSLAIARPRLHCFGHIHEAWGAKLVTWDGTATESAGVGRSTVIEGLRSLEITSRDGNCAAAGSSGNHNRNTAKNYHFVSLCSEDGLALRPESQTLFVNAAIMDLHYRPTRLPWLVDLELPLATDVDRQKASQTTGVGDEKRPSLADISPLADVYPRLMELWTKLQDVYS